MKFFFYIPGMPADANVMANLSLGGSESAGMYMSRELVRLGHEVKAFTNGQPGWWDEVEICPIGQSNQTYQEGEIFGRQSEIEPHDVLIVQRTPAPFLRMKNSKINLMSMHDLARMRNRGQIKGTLWNCQGILGVSDWHSAQIKEVHDFPDGYVHTIRNGIDLSLYDVVPNYQRKWRGKKIIYASRPERGLVNFVKPDGIMDKLRAIDPDITLVVCCYDNVTEEMRPLYQHLWARCHELPNVELLGNLSKRALAEVMRDCTSLVYPVVPETAHEETSCISVMEAQAAGCNVIACANGAIGETANFPGDIGEEVRLIPYMADGSVADATFVNAIASQFQGSSEKWESLAKIAYDRGKQYGWEKPTGELVELVGRTLHERSSNIPRLAKHFAYYSDRAALKKLVDFELPPFPEIVTFFKKTDFTEAVSLKEFYEEENALAIANGNSPDAEEIAKLKVSQDTVNILNMELLKGPMTVLDYGCRVGALISLLARQFPECTFYGVDIADAAIKEAKKKNKDSTNTHFAQGDILNGNNPFPDKKFDVVLCQETLEHVIDPSALVTELEKLLNNNGRIVLTMPTGPLESVSHWQRETAWEHIQHFEYADVDDLWGHKPGLKKLFSGYDQNAPGGEPIGGQTITWLKNGTVKENGTIDWERKLKVQAPRETLSVCMIVASDASSIVRTLRTIEDIADEIIIGVDEKNTAPDLVELRDRWDLEGKEHVQMFWLKNPPLEKGFDKARNETLEVATCDWILWIDSDEEFVYPKKLLKYLRPNCYEAYALAQNHLSSEPAGVLKIDYPCRLFRNGLGFKFFGMVHEHPSREADDVPKHVMMLGENIGIQHTGYINEEVRQERFHRNWPLMIRDREKYPMRSLGEFLMLRDLLHVIKFELQKSGGKLDENMHNMAVEALTIFDKFIEKKEIRFIIESLEYAGEAAKIVGGGNCLQMNLAIQVNHQVVNAAGITSEPRNVQGVFKDPQTAQKVLKILAEDQLSEYEGKYL